MSDIPKPEGSLTPAYGRDYATAEEFLKDWNDNKDFVINNPMQQTYINKADAERYGGDHFQIRYNQIQDVNVLQRAADGTWSVCEENEKEERTYWMVADEGSGEGNEWLSSTREGYARSRLATEEDITPDSLAMMLDQEAENENSHDFVGVHYNLVDILLDETDEDAAKEIMRRIANQGGLHKMSGR